MLHNTDPGSTSSKPSWLKPLWGLAVLAFFAYGMWTFPIALLGPDRSQIPGDLGDARFNNYILEHFHLFVTGKADDYWNAPFMYPQKNVTAFSDNLLGTAPIYSAIRSAGLNRESAFQLWILLLFCLNFWCCFAALYTWSGQTIGSAAGAFIFAFGIFQLGQLCHIQTLPRFATPLAFLFIWRYLDIAKLHFLLLATLSIVYQFYCGIYLGFLLLYALSFLIIGYAIAYRHRISFRTSLSSRRIWHFALASILFLVMLAPLMLPYIDTYQSAPPRDLATVFDSLPTVSSYFFSHPAAMSWQDLAENGSRSFPKWWEHQLFPGGICWLAVLTAVFLIAFRRIASEGARTTTALLLGLLLSMAFSINIDGSSLYKIIFELPGFSVLRSMGRLINIQILFFILIFLSLLSALPSRKWASLIVMPLIPIAVILDNKIDVGRIKTYNKWSSRNMIADVERDITAQHHQGVGPIAYMPILPIIEEELVHDRVIATNITAMLAAQQLGIPIVNGYSGSYPEGYMDLFDHMDDRSLSKWCEHAGCDAARIKKISNILLPFIDTDTVTLQAGNGNFICANTQRNGSLVADRPAPLLWETYRLICTTDGRIALLAHNGNFVCAELLQHKQVSATAPDLGDFGLFEKVDLDDDLIALKAHNDRFLSVNDEGLIHASADSIGERERFKLR